MALSNSYSFSVTATDIVREAMLNIGAIGEAEVPTAQEFTDCLRKLNMMIKQWMGKQDFAPGLKMWTRQRGDLFLSSSKGQYLLGPTGDNWAGGVTSSATANFQTSQLTAAVLTGGSTITVGTTNIANFTVGDFVVIQLSSGDTFSTSVGTINPGAGTFTLGNANTMPSGASGGAYCWNYTVKGQRPLALLTGLLRDSVNNDIPMNVMTLQDYEYLPTKTQAQYLADPTAWYYESQIGSGLNTPVITGPGVLYLDIGGAQDVTKHLHFVYLRPIMDLVNSGDNPEYPQQWYRALCWGLSREICAMFDAGWTKDMDDNLDESLMMARQADAEVSSFYFEAYSEEQP
jgi:hypothetical protein